MKEERNILWWSELVKNVSFIYKLKKRKRLSNAMRRDLGITNYRVVLGEVQIATLLIMNNS